MILALAQTSVDGLDGSGSDGAGEGGRRYAQRHTSLNVGKGPTDRMVMFVMYLGRLGASGVFPPSFLQAPEADPCRLGPGSNCYDSIGLTTEQKK